MPEGIMKEVVAAAIARGSAPPDSSLWGIAPGLFGHAARPAGFVVDVADWVPRKLAALRCHRTQMGLHNPFAWIDSIDARRCLGRELFRRAPFATARTPILERLGEPVANA
jgi:LmbE family N-acetylglucosaminyl deacetylase